MKLNMFLDFFFNSKLSSKTVTHAGPQMSFKSLDSPLSVRLDWQKLLELCMLWGRLKLSQSCIGFISHTAHSNFSNLSSELRNVTEQNCRPTFYSKKERKLCFLQNILTWCTINLARMKNGPFKNLASFRSGYFADISGGDLDGCSDTNVAISSPREAAARAA